MKCSFEDCDKPGIALQLCSGHYKQMWLGKSLSPLQSFAIAAQVENGRKQCRTCKQTKDIKDFYALRKRSKIYYPLDCKPCYIAQVRKKK